MSDERRGAGARAGIAALNILWPGLGLLRTGSGRLAAFFMAVPLAAWLLVVACYALLPRLTFGTWVTLMAAVLVACVGAILLSAALTWRRSRVRAEPEPWWSRWSAVAGAWVLLAAATALVPVPQSRYRSFYVPSESMLPTFAVNDRFIAQMKDIGPLRRGDIVLVRTRDGFIYNSRIAALGGDRIGLVEGRVVLNGVPVPQSLVGTEASAVNGMSMPVRRFAERFPGEARMHHVYDTGPSLWDDFETVTVAPGHVFLLGDNRDHAADSRVPRAQAGLEQVPVADVVGRPLFFSWWPGMAKSGQPIAH
jgi:signal peptidase I